MTDRTAADELARYYDLDLLDDPGDLELYLALARRREGAVLELACGSGRIAAPLAAAGHDVVGVDLDAAMLSRAERRGRRGTAEAVDDGGRHGSLELIHGDLLAADLGARFSLAILALNSLFLLSRNEEQLGALRALARHLEPDGIAVVDVWIPSIEDLEAFDGRLLLEWIRDDAETGERVAKLASARHDAATRTTELTAIFDSWPDSGGPVRRVHRTDVLHHVSADELVALAERAGLRLETLAGDYAMTPFGPDASRAVLVAGLL